MVGCTNEFPMELNVRMRALTLGALQTFVDSVQSFCAHADTVLERMRAMQMASASINVHGK
jgi:hypothetical protein